MKKVLLLTAALLGLSAPMVMAGDAIFTRTVYFDEKPLGDAGVYRNPILPGFFPDPSITRVGEDYYLINSSFAFFPGIPVFHSKDMVHWSQIGNAIDRPGMLDFSGLNTSRGVFAPDISYHDGTFYIVNTCVDCKGNFIITAKDPAGPWSDPVWLPFGGIDPSLFWDDDGKTYIVYNDAPEGKPLYDGHRALWLQPFDPRTNALVGPRKVVVNGGVDLAKKPVWIEGPHIFRKDGHYYLMAAEGGTAEGHSEVIFRGDTVWGPYLPYGDNPILTQRDLDPARSDPVTSTGHADLVQTQKGDWWAVFLGTQPYSGNLYNTGRETFMLPVNWKDGWPVILDHGQAVPKLNPAPAITAPPMPQRTEVHSLGHVRGKGSPEILQVRTPSEPFFAFSDFATVALSARPEAIGDVTSHPSFLGLRQTAPAETIRTVVIYTPVNDGDRAGLVALQSDDFYIFFGIARRGGKPVLEVTRRSGAADPRDGVVVASAPLKAKPGTALELTLTIAGGTAHFAYNDTKKGNVTLADAVDVTNLSTAKAGGFVGTIVGVYAYGQKP